MVDREPIDEETGDMTELEKRLKVDKLLRKMLQDNIRQRVESGTEISAGMLLDGIIQGKAIIPELRTKELNIILRDYYLTSPDEVMPRIAKEEIEKAREKYKDEPDKLRLIL